MANKTNLYVAYGSNLHIGQMTHRCPTAKVVGASVLNGRRLLFRGGRGGAVATVEPYKGGSVPVLVWEIQPADEEALDRYEGYPFLYRKEKVKIMLEGKRRTAMVYIMNTEGRGGECRPLNQPGAGYYTTILDGYKAAGFDTEILRKATEDSVDADDIPLDETIISGIRKIKDTGLTNMFDAITVQRIAFDMGFYELVDFIETNRKAYAHIILTGKMPD